MTNFRDYLSKLFPGKGGASKVVLNEVIKRSTPYQERYDMWAASERPALAYAAVAEGYQAKLLNEEGPGVQVHILRSQYANGIAISFHNSGMSKEQFSFLFDHMAEKIRQLEGYRRVNADYLITEKQNFVETKEKYYLKPVVTKDTTVVNQRYGNILIEHILNDDQPIYIKLAANIYSDSNYNEAESFEGLMSYLLN